MNTTNQAGVWRLHNDKNWQVRIKAEVEKTFKTAGIINFTNSEFISTLEVLVDNIEASFKRGESSEAINKGQHIDLFDFLEAYGSEVLKSQDNNPTEFLKSNQLYAHPSAEAVSEEQSTNEEGECTGCAGTGVHCWGGIDSGESDSRYREVDCPKCGGTGMEPSPVAAHPSPDAGNPTSAYNSDCPLSHAGQRLVDKQLEEGVSICHQPLFNLMANDHGLTLLNSEMDEIIRVVIKMIEPSSESLEERAKGYIGNTYGNPVAIGICDIAYNSFLAGANYILKQQKGE